MRLTATHRNTWHLLRTLSAKQFHGQETRSFTNNHGSAVESGSERPKMHMHNDIHAYFIEPHKESRCLSLFFNVTVNSGEKYR